MAALSLDSASIESLTADFAALLHISVRSAPENPSVNLPKKSKSIFLANGVFLKQALKIETLEGRSGNGMYKS